MSKVGRLFKFIKENTSKHDFPHAVNYEITARCNCKCEHCYWRKTLDTPDELTDEEWEQLFTDHRANGAHFAYLTGGEPALRPNVIRMAARIFDGIGIVSNGSIPIPDDVQCRIFVSIDGPREVHDSIRGVKLFERVLATIHGDKRVILTPTLTTTNYTYIDDLIAITRQAEVEGITFSTYTSHQLEGDPLLLEGEKLEATIQKLLAVWTANRDIVYLTPKIIRMFRTKPYAKHCYFRGKNFISFDAQARVKKPCTLGPGVNCATCGCIVPMVAHALKRVDIRSFTLMDRLFPEAYLEY